MTILRKFNENIGIFYLILAVSSNEKCVTISAHMYIIDHVIYNITIQEIQVYSQVNEKKFK